MKTHCPRQVSYARTARLHTSNNVHVVSLAAADTLVAAISMPVTAIRMSRNEKYIDTLYLNLIVVCVTLCTCAG